AEEVSVNAASIRADAAAAASVANPWLIAVVVALASFMEVLDTTIANVALPYIAGGMGVSEDEASWVVTTYLVSNAIVLTASSFLARMFGRKTFFLICLGLFTLSSLLCGFAPNLNALLLFRILQGFGGGGMVPVPQSCLADSFPPAKRGQAFAVFGVAVVVAPVVGPTLGGWLSDNLSWQWCFLINAPVGVLAMALIAAILREPKRQQSQQQDHGVRRHRLHIGCDLPRCAGGRALGVGLPLIFVPIMAASYDGIPQSQTDQASALINAARNTGGSIGVSIVSNVLTHREQFHQSRLVESMLPSSVQYQGTLHQVTDYFVAQGNSLLQAQQQ